MGIKRVKEYVQLVLEIESPEVCQECVKIDPLVRGFVDQTLFSLNLIEQGYQIGKEVYISEGIVTSCNADIIGEAIKITINNIREKYNLSELN